jgi:hypothetical protein
VLSHRNKQLLLLQGISFEVHGGEIMAVMATSGMYSAPRNKF